MENNPRVVFERLFGDGGGSAERLIEAERNRSLLDGVLATISGLRTRVGAKDNQRLSEYLDSVREIERRIQMVEQRAAQSSLAVPEKPVGIPETFEEHVKLLYDLWALAFQADITRVGTFQVSYETNTRTYPQIGVSEAHHSLSHHGHDPQKIAQLVRINTYHVQMLAYFLDKLRNTPDGDGTLLDHALIMYGGAMSDGNNHSHSKLPCLLAGGAAGRLRGGRHLAYDNNPELSRALLNVLDIMEIPGDSFHDATGVSDRLPSL
jgi:hypothetical protein